jgi:hypothetical protein
MLGPFIDKIILSFRIIFGSPLAKAKALNFKFDLQDNLWLLHALMQKA